MARVIDHMQALAVRRGLPSGALMQRGFTNEQIFAAIEARSA